MKSAAGPICNNPCDPGHVAPPNTGDYPMSLLPYWLARPFLFRMEAEEAHEQVGHIPYQTHLSQAAKEYHEYYEAAE